MNCIQVILLYQINLINARSSSFRVQGSKVQRFRVLGSGFWVLDSAQPLAVEAATLIKEKTSLEPEKKLKHVVGSRRREMNSIWLIL
jgi:hypothetical protein